MARVFRIGTRKSELALRQTQRVVEAISVACPGFSHEIVHITTTGDKFMGDLKKVGGKDVFVKEIEEALQKGEIDLAMHSVKDMPADLPQGLILGGVLPRNDIRDMAVCREGDSFVNLKEGARVGTSSLRRASQLLAAFPYLEVVPVRGNVLTRLEKLNKKEVDALVLAKAGFDLLEKSDLISVVFEPDMICPSACQGTIGMECRENDKELRALLDKINDEKTMACTEVERHLIRKLGGGCHTPVGGFCELTNGGNLRLIAMVAEPDGSRVVRARHKMAYHEREELADAVVRDLLAGGAADILSGTAA